MRIHPLSIQEVTDQLHHLGVEPGRVLIVHTAFSKVAPVENGPLGLIQALRAALGETGTLVMPSMTDDDDSPFDPATTPCRGLGIVADTFWRQPGVLRTNSPHAFAAIGPHAKAITADQPLHIPHGPDSPVGRVHNLNGQVLLLGVNHDSNTTVHLAEALANVQYRAPKHCTVLENGIHKRFEYSETDHCCERFNLMNAWLDETNEQRRGLVGHAEARLAQSQAIVRLATSHLDKNLTVFLHPFGVDDECNFARASIGEIT